MPRRPATSTPSAWSLYECLAGRRPFDGDSPVAHRARPPARRPARRCPTDVPAGLRAAGRHRAGQGPGRPVRHRRRRSPPRCAAQSRGRAASRPRCSPRRRAGSPEGARRAGCRWAGAGLAILAVVLVLALAGRRAEPTAAGPTRPPPRHRPAGRRSVDPARTPVLVRVAPDYVGRAAPARPPTGCGRPGCRRRHRHPVGTRAARWPAPSPACPAGQVRSGTTADRCRVVRRPARRDPPPQRSHGAGRTPTEHGQRQGEGQDRSQTERQHGGHEPRRAGAPDAASASAAATSSASCSAAAAWPRSARAPTCGSAAMVAIKRLRTDLASDATFQARFRREAQSAASLNHPAIVSVYDTGEEHVDRRQRRPAALHRDGVRRRADPARHPPRGPQDPARAGARDHLRRARRARLQPPGRHRAPRHQARRT